MHYCWNDNNAAMAVYPGEDPGIEEGGEGRVKYAHALHALKFYPWPVSLWWE